jgi:hypothetical protein
MEDTDTIAETKAAIDALVYRLRNRGDADDEPFAQEFVAALKARGWRPTPAGQSPGWDRQFGGGSEPSADYLAAKAAVKALPPLPEHRVARP